MTVSRANPNEAFDRIARCAVECSDCFQRFGVERPVVHRAQPRWIGPNYAETTPRVVWLMTNPGSGGGRRDDADYRLSEKLETYAQGGDLEPIMAHQRNDMENWGRGRFARFLVAAGLKLDDIALMNLAWCATAENKYPRQMLATCFDRFTQAALGALAPDIVVLSGSASHSFAGLIENSCPGASIVKTLHYAHREGNVAENRATAELRSLLAI